MQTVKVSLPYKARSSLYVGDHKRIVQIVVTVLLFYVQDVGDCHFVTPFDAGISKYYQFIIVVNRSLHIYE